MPARVYRASTDVINEFAKLDVAGIWGDGQVVAVDGSQVDTWENNLLAESHIRYGGYGGIAMRHVAGSYIALFSHFIPCGVWEAVYIIDGLLRNESDIQPDTVHADTQGQSLPVFGLAALLGFELLPRIRNWHDLNFYRPDARVRYQHIDELFDGNAIDWATTPARTGCTGRFASWAGWSARSRCCGTCPNPSCGSRSPRSPTRPRGSTSSPHG